MESDPLRKYKVVLVGYQKAGKTTLHLKLMSQALPEEYRPTVGIDFASLPLPAQPIRLQLWDTAGQERYHALIPAYLRDAAVICFVYSAADQVSFSKVNTFLEILSAEKLQRKPVLLLIANQIDLERQVTTETGEQFAVQHDMLYLEFSAVNDPRQVMLDKVCEAVEKWELTA